MYRMYINFINSLPQGEPLVKLDLASVPSCLECSVMSKNLMYDCQDVGRALAVVGRRVTAQSSSPVQVSIFRLIFRFNPINLRF